MTDAAQTVDAPLLDDIPLADLGSISIRVVVLPPKAKSTGDEQGRAEELPLDLDPSEMLPESGSTPVRSYLESSKGGKRCCVFLVNGQRQDSLDNGFIIQDLGFKYLRNRMIIIVDVDGLAPEAIGRIMQGSRHGFYKGKIWAAILHRIVATLKDDPDLERLEEEAEEQVAQLEAGDEKVRHTLDQLINAHHDAGMRMLEGMGVSGDTNTSDSLGLRAVIEGGVVTLLPPEKDEHADYPVLISKPSTTIRLRPNQMREVTVTSQPLNAWPGLSSLSIESDPNLPELEVNHQSFDDRAKVQFHYREPADADAKSYPLRATVPVRATFNGIKEPRHLALGILIDADKPAVTPVLLDSPTELKITSREPVKIRQGQIDSHVRIRWNGKDDLLMGPGSLWRLSAQVLNSTHPQPRIAFSEPNAGRFSLLVSPRPEWTPGEWLEFEVSALGPNNRVLQVTFIAEVVDENARPSRPPPKPRLIDSNIMVGSSRRPPYELRYIDRAAYEVTECWGDSTWTDDDPGCFREPTERTPLRLIINKDMQALADYRRLLTDKSSAESEIERRINKYTSHVAFHLYQMYQAASERHEEDMNVAEANRRHEIQRVAMTLIKLMEVSR